MILLSPFSWSKSRMLEISQMMSLSDYLRLSNYVIYYTIFKYNFRYELLPIWGLRREGIQKGVCPETNVSV